MARREERVWDRFSGIYDAFMKSDKSAYKELIDRIKLILAPDAAVLEVAAGTGIISLGLAGQARHVEAVDFSPKMVALAREKAGKLGASGINFSVQNALDLDFDSGCFDAAIIANTLHIMPEPEKALDEIRRILKPNGKLIAPTFIHAGNKKAAALSKLMSFTGFRAYHKWTQQSYHAFLEKNGFTIADFALLEASFPIAYVVAEKTGRCENESGNKNLQCVPTCIEGL